MATTGVDDADFTHIATDSRKLRAATSGTDHTLFIALSGARHDGHDHLAEVRAQGVKGFIVRSDWPGALPGAIVLRVPDPLLALQQLGALARFSRSGTVVGITGSNGKTTVKEWAHALLGTKPPNLQEPRQLEQPGRGALALWSLDDQADVHLVEAGISHPGEMAALARIIRPDVGVFVHFGDAHGTHFPLAGQGPRKTAALRGSPAHRPRHRPPGCPASSGRTRVARPLRHLVHIRQSGRHPVAVAVALRHRMH